MSKKYGFMHFLPTTRAHKPTLQEEEIYLAMQLFALWTSDGGLDMLASLNVAICGTSA